MDNDYLQVFTTVEKREDAEAIARKLVQEKLAGCVQVIGPITSTYWWKGAIETAQEWLCIIKTGRALYSQIEEAVRRIHPYDVPEIIAVSVTAGSENYLRWLDSVLMTKK